LHSAKGNSAVGTNGSFGTVLIGNGREPHRQMQSKGGT
jgi:hypothetical protein